MTTVYRNELAPFFRVSWVSKKAAAVWAPRLAGIRNMFYKQRDELVLDNVIGFYQDSIFGHLEEKVKNRLKEKGLVYYRLHHREEQVRNLVHHSKLEDEACHHYFAGKSETIEVIRKAVQKDKNELVWQQAGMASCCAEAYQAFLKSGRQDPLAWVAVQELSCSGTISTCAARLLLSAVFEVPLTPRFNCSAACKQAELTWKTILDKLKALQPEESRWLEEIMHWPMHWSALHGIAEVKTPVAKFIYRTDVTGEKWTLVFSGTRYPREGASGLSFPYKKRPSPSLI